MSPIAPIKKKLANAIAMLSSPNNNERREAWKALNAVLRGANATLVDLAEWLRESEAPAKSDGGMQQLSQAEIQELYAAAFADGQRSVQGDVFDPLVPDWKKMADVVGRYLHELNARERAFAEDMIQRIRWGCEPTPKQANWFSTICIRLGRRHGFTV